MKISAHTRTVHDASVAVGWAGDRTLTIDRSSAAGGQGLGYNGGELLFLAIAACYSNDVFREAAKMGVAVSAVDVDVDGDFGGEPVRATNVQMSVRVEADASQARIEELIRHTDKVAEISNSMRFETPVTLATVEAVVRKPPT